MDEETNAEMGEGEVAPDVEIELSNPDRVAYRELTEQFGEELILADIEGVVQKRIRSLYDNQEQVRQRIQQAQQQAGGM